jgi:hypothetical protein
MRPKTLRIATTAALALATCFGASAENGMTQRQQRLLEQSMHMVTPMGGQMSRIAMELQLEVLAEPETARKLASFTRNYYQALIEAGFTESQALEIVIRAGVPLQPAANTSGN